MIEYDEYGRPCVERWLISAGCFPEYHPKKENIFIGWWKYCVINRLYNFWYYVIKNQFE